MSACAGSTARRIQTASVDIEDDTLLTGLANHAPSGIVFKTKAEYQPLQLVLDQQRIETTYREQGYFSAKVLGAEVEDIDDEEVALVFRVDEGKPTLLERVEILGAPEDDPSLNARELGRTAALVMDMPLTYDSYLQAADRLKSKMLARGYAYAVVYSSLTVDRARGRATATYAINAGPIAVFGDVKIEGLDRTPQVLVLNRLAWTPGERFDPVKLEKTRLSLYSTGLVGNVRFSWDKDERSDVLDLKLQASEGTRHEIRLGGGVGVDRQHYELRGRLGYTHRNFIDPRVTLRFQARPGIGFLSVGSKVILNLDTELELERLDFLFPLLRGKIGVEYLLNEYDAYSVQGPGVQASIGRFFMDDRLAVALTTSYRWHSFPRIEPAVQAVAEQIGLDDPESFVFIEPSVAWDSRDDPRSPSDGILLRMGVELGQVLSGDTPHPYLKITPEARGYWAFGDRVVVAARVRFGTNVSALGRVPLTQRYLSGGADTQRGFGRGRLAPFVRGENNESLPIGGGALVETNAEIRIGLFDIMDSLLSMVTFVDGADVADRFGELKFPNLHYAVGGGFRYDTPVGPIRADVGFRVNRTGPNDPDPDSPFALHLSIGEAF